MMKIFLRREGGQVPTYIPQGIIDTDNLSSEEAQQVINALKPEIRKIGGSQKMPISDAFEYLIRLEETDGSTEEFQLQESELDTKTKQILNLLMNKIQQSIKNS